MDEFGGIKWDPATQADAASGLGQNLVSWGYGQAPASLEEFYRRLEGLVRAVIAHGHICGWCYTQLTDVEQETERDLLLRPLGQVRHGANQADLLDRAVAGHSDERRSFHASYSDCASPVSG